MIYGYEVGFTDLHVMMEKTMTDGLIDAEDLDCSSAEDFLEDGEDGSCQWTR